MNKHCLTFALLILLLPPLCPADDTDSTFVPPLQDSTVTDSMAVDSSTTPDSSFDARYDEFVKSRPRHQQPVSFFDTLVAYFASERISYMPQVEQAFYNDAGDYFRLDPSYFILEQVTTPMRKTVQAFGLPGGRLNYLVKDLPLRPFEHMPEPDGLYDMNDFPTGADDAVYILPGAGGYVFGGQDMLASIITMPAEPETTEPVSAIKADKGSFGYAYTRGNYSKNFNSGRELDLSVDYRATDGLAVSNDDDAYHYWGDAYFPLGVKGAFRVTGQLYNRTGHISVRQDVLGKLIPRERFDRNLKLSFEYQNDDSTARSEIGYQHLRQGSYTTEFYRTRFNITGHGTFAVREWVRGSSMYQARIYGNHVDYDQGFNSHDRFDGGLSLGVVHTGEPGRWAARVGGRYVEQFDFLPSAAVQYMRETGRSFLAASIGFGQLEPSLHEQHKLYQKADIYQSSELPYADEGNPELTGEKQLVGNLIYEYGTLRNRLNLTLTGGRMFDGIQWQRTVAGILDPVILFSPINTDIDFANATLKQTLTVGDFARLNAGAAYHFIEFEKHDSGAYQPDYQLFSGLELHVYWAQKLLHLFAYSEVVVTGLYDGYRRVNLGERAIINTKLSFRIKNFRFHYVFQNLLGISYESREYMTIPGRFNYYGITWSFFN